MLELNFSTTGLRTEDIVRKLGYTVIQTVWGRSNAAGCGSCRQRNRQRNGVVFGEIKKRVSTDKAAYRLFEWHCAMADVHTKEKRSYNMSKIRAKDTVPELIIRHGLHRLGFRYRLHKKNLPGKPDLVLARYRAVVLVHGCFWHRHDCGRFNWPKENKRFWRDKITATQERDKINRKKLMGSGWRVLEIWECALTGLRRRPHRDVIKEVADWITSDERYYQITGSSAGPENRTEI